MQHVVAMQVLHAQGGLEEQIPDLRVWGEIAVGCGEGRHGR